MKKTKIIVPALGMLLLSTAASVTGTVAWFSANNKVSVTGMTVSTKVKGNLLIAGSNLDDDAHYEASNFNANVQGILEPVSSVNGVSFFYTKEKVSGTGATTATSLQTYTDDATLASYYDVTGAKAFVDYTFYLKVTTDEDNQKVVISRFNLLYNGNAIGSEKAWRVAVFAEKVVKNAAGSAAAAGNLKTIVAPNGAANFVTGKAYNTATTKDSVVKAGLAADLDQINNKGTTQRYKIIARMYLEGEDTTCNNETFAELTEEYTLNLVCELKSSANNGANEIMSSGAATISSTTLTASVDVNTAELNEEITGYQWQKKDNLGVWGDIENANASTYTGSNNDVVRCRVTTASGVYYSGSVKLTNS